MRAAVAPVPGKQRDGQIRESCSKFAPVVQRQETADLKSEQYGFESLEVHQVIKTNMKYWIYRNETGKIVLSGFDNKPVDGEYETNIHKYTIDDCVLEGTEFQKKVWKAISEIPAGKTKSYGELVAVCGGSPLAVGTACGKNKIPVVIPCHRVVGKKNKLAYSGGESTKRELLKIEGVII